MFIDDSEYCEFSVVLAQRSLSAFYGWRARGLVARGVHPQLRGDSSLEGAWWLLRAGASGVCEVVVLRSVGLLLSRSERSKRGCVLPDEVKAESFTEFVTTYETRLRQALTVVFGVERGKEAAAEALAYGWEHWDRVFEMDNPSGYLYRVGYDRARRMTRRKLRLPAVDADRQPWIEPGFPKAFAALPEQQRMVVALLYGYQWSMAEVAEHLGVSKGTVQTHARRGLDRLRRKLRAEL